MCVVYYHSKAFFVFVSSSNETCLILGGYNSTEFVRSNNHVFVESFSWKASRVAPRCWLYNDGTERCICRVYDGPQDFALTGMILPAAIKCHSPLRCFAVPIYRGLVGHPSWVRSQMLHIQLASLYSHVPRGTSISHSRTGTSASHICCTMVHVCCSWGCILLI